MPWAEVGGINACAERSPQGGLASPANRRYNVHETFRASAPLRFNYLFLRFGFDRRGGEGGFGGG